MLTSANWSYSRILRTAATCAMTGMLFVVNSSSGYAETLDGTYRCAARPLIPLSFDQYKTRFDSSVTNPAAAYQAIGTASVESAMRLYYDNVYRPRDANCIVGAAVSVAKLVDANVYDTSGGDVFLLVPLPDGSFDQVRAAPATLFHQRAASLAGYLRVSWRNTEMNRGVSLCIRSGTNGEPSESCLRTVERSLNRREQELASYLAFKTPPPASSIRVLTYNASPTTDAVYDANYRAFNGFLTAVHVQEFAMSARYDRREYLGSFFNVFDQSLSKPFDAYSLSDFVGTVAAELADDRNYEAFLRIPEDLGTRTGPRPQTVKTSELVAADFSRFRKGDALNEMIRGFICRNGTDAAVALHAMPATMQSSFATFQFYSCDTQAFRGLRVIDWTEFYSMDADVPRGELGLMLIANRIQEVTNALNELQRIQLDQSKILLAVQRYVASGDYETRIDALSARLKAMETEARGASFLQVALAIGSAATGVSGFAGGVKGLVGLIKLAPSGGAGIGDLVNFYESHAAEFKKHSKAASDGYTAFNTGVWGLSTRRSTGSDRAPTLLA
jgi:hypothetical protein